MWVEISERDSTKREIAVILFVRMWVEIHILKSSIAVLPSSSSWGCELKWLTILHTAIPYSHPLREDVSWNSNRVNNLAKALVILFVRMWVEITTFIPFNEFIRSSSSWGCELKWYSDDNKAGKVWSSSSWGCELKFLIFQVVQSLFCHPLREDVSWNFFTSLGLTVSFVILFVRMWVEMTQRMQKVGNPSVILFVRMWVEI